MQIEGFHLQVRKQGVDLLVGIGQVVEVAFVGPVTTVGAAIFVIDETDRVDVVDLYGQLHVLQHHLVIVHAARQRDDVEVIIPEADGDPRLEEFLQAVVHAMDDQRVAMDDGFTVQNLSPSKVSVVSARSDYF